MYVKYLALLTDSNPIIIYLMIVYFYIAMSGYGGYNPNAPPGGSYGAPSAPPGGPRPGGVPPGGVHPGGVHPGGVHPGGVHPGGVHPGGVHPGGIHPGGVPPGGVPPGGSYGAGPPQGASYGGYAAQTAGYAAQPAGYGTPPGGYGGTAYQGAPVQPVAQQGPNLQQIFFRLESLLSSMIMLKRTIFVSSGYIIDIAVYSFIPFYKYYKALKIYLAL